MSVKNATIYIAPGDSRCSVYLIPYPMRPGQSPQDIAHKYQQDWKQVGLLNSELRIVWVEPKLRHLAGDIAGQMGGTYFEVEQCAGGVIRTLD